MLCSTLQAQEIDDNDIAVQQVTTEQAPSKNHVKIGLIVFPPAAYNDPEGNCIGSGVDAIKNIFTPEEYELSIYCATPARVYRDFLNGTIDLTVNVKSTKNLSQNVYFSENPHIVLRVMLYTKDLQATGKISSIKPFNYHGAKQQLIDQGYKMVTQSNSKEAMAVFLRGGTQGLISYQLPYLFYRESLNVLFQTAPANKDISETELLQVPSYFVVNRANPNAEAIMAHINQNNQ
jgi:hypothetical protein